MPVDPGACRQARPPRARRASLGADRELRPGGHHAAVPPAQAAERAAQYRALATGRRSAPAPGREHLGAAPCPPAAAVCRRHDRRQRRAVCPGPEAAALLGRAASAFARARGGSLLVSTSARTPKQAIPALEAALDYPAEVFRWTRDAAENPHLGYLALADLDHRDLREHVDADRGVRHLEARLHVRPAHRSRESLGIAREPDRRGRHVLVATRPPPAPAAAGLSHRVS